MLPDRVSNPEPLIYESDALPIALRGPAGLTDYEIILQEGFLCDPLPKFLKLFRSIEQDGHQS